MSQAYTFIFFKQKDYIKNLDKKFQDFLEKWGMKGYLMIQHYGFNQEFHVYNQKQLCECFFNDPSVINSLKIIRNDKWDILKQSPANVSIKMLSCSTLSMNYFDRLLQGENGVTCGDGYITKCEDEEIGEILIQDNLRQLLLNPESEVYQLYSEEERDEFIFRIFKHLVVGGRLCQYEDDIKNYIECTKILYRDLVSVLKDPETKNLKITTVVFEVKVQDFNGENIYPRDPGNPQNFAYIIVDPPKRELKVLTHYQGVVYLE